MPAEAPAWPEFDDDVASAPSSRDLAALLALAADLAALDYTVDGVEALLGARPDLVVPLPRDLSELASRATTSASRSSRCCWPPTSRWSTTTTAPCGSSRTR